MPHSNFAPVGATSELAIGALEAAVAAAVVSAINGGSTALVEYKRGEVLHKSNYM